MPSSSNTSTSASSTTMGLSTAVVAVLAASAAHYYYTSSSSSKNTTKNESSTTTTTTTMSRGIGDVTTENNRLERWENRWSTGKTQWHKTDVHASLYKYCDEYLIDSIIGGGGRILVPLCGKTVDMVYLARKRIISEVVGIDGIPKAIEEFMQEQSNEGFDFKDPEVVNGYTKHKGESITLITGDFFDITLDVINGNDTSKSSSPLLFDGVWDRGSLVAIDPSLREKYVDKIGEVILKPNGKYLLATFLRPNNDTTSGPPFSLDETEIRRLFGTKPWVDTITLLDSHSFLGLEPWYKAISTYFRLGNIKEEIYIITTK